MSQTKVMKPQQITTDVLLEKYAKNNENSELDIFKRVAKGLASVEKTEELRNKYEDIFYTNLLDGGLGAGRIMAAAGSDIKATLCNCFVQPIGDSIEDPDEDGNPSIYDAVKKTAVTMRRGGGVGYNFSNIRPKGSLVKSLSSIASGPCSYIDLFDVSTTTIESAGARRGANLGALNITHPDILSFIEAKRTKGKWTQFNISVLVPDWFMEAKEKDETIELVHKATPSRDQIKNGAYLREDGLWVYSTIKAKTLWDIIMRSNYEYAEPGILFEDSINRDNNLRYIEYINTTNPCVTGDTLILTDKGYKRIDSLVNTEVTIWNGYEWSVVTPVVTATNQEILDIELSDGSNLSCTPYHKFVLNDNTKVQARDLVIGDTLTDFNLPVIDGTKKLEHSEICNHSEVPGSEYLIQDRRKWLRNLLITYGKYKNDVYTISSKDKGYLVKIKYLLNTDGIKCYIEKKDDFYILTVPNSDTIRISIISISKRKNLEEKVYCFNEPINHTGIFNGIITGNCGEQPLPPYGCCDLGPIVLPRLVVDPFTVKAKFDFEKLVKMVTIQVRMLDNVLDATLWPLKEQEVEAMSKRRIGVGLTGIGNTLAMLNIPYNSKEGLELSEKILRIMMETAYIASIDLAKEKGSFPLLNVDKYLEDGTFASRLPDSIKDNIRKYGIRNSHLLSIAPVGTVSLAFADNTSNGIEPPFSLAYTRKKRMMDGTTSYYNVLDHSFRVYLSTLYNDEYAAALEEAVCNYRDKFEYDNKVFKTKDCIPNSLITALEMSVDDHLSILKIARPYIDSAISKTLNVPEDYPFDDFKTIYDKAWKYGLKGIATYRPNSILGSVLSTEPVISSTEKVNDEDTKYEYNLEEIVKNLYIESYDRREDGALTGISVKDKFYTDQGEQKFILTINFKEITSDTPYGVVTISRPFEFLLTSNFGSNKSVWDSSMRFMSLIGRSGISIDKMIENLKEVTWEYGLVKYGRVIKNGKNVPKWHKSDAAVIGYVIEETLKKTGHLDENGKQLYKYTIKEQVPVNEVDIDIKIQETDIDSNTIIPGKPCPECNAAAVIKLDGCERCTSCGWQGVCS